MNEMPVVLFNRTCRSGRACGVRSISAQRGRGFTLIELMVIVVIIGVLASLATVGYRRYVNDAKTSEAREIIGNIKAGQESYLDETFQYLNVSAALGGVSSYYPQLVPTGVLKTQWGGAGDPFAPLGVSAAAPVYFGYSSIAGDGTAGLDSQSGFGVLPNTNRPQYLVKAACDVEPGGTVTVFVSSNIQADIYGENVGQ